MKTLREQLGKPVLFHRVGWHGKNGASLTGYDSRDIGVISRQLDAMQDWGGEGAGIAHLCYGASSTFMLTSCLEVCNQCSARKMPFVLVFDPWVVKDPSTGQILPSPARENAYISSLHDPTIQLILNAPNYLSGKPIMDFDTTANIATVAAAVPGIKFWMKGKDYDWAKIPGQLNVTPLPCKLIEFNDGTGPDRNKSRWNQSQPARIVPSLAGGTFWSMDCSKAVDYIQIVTWDDVDEGTDTEKFAAILTGRI